MTGVSSFNRFPTLRDVLPQIVQAYIDQAAHAYADELRAGVPADAIAGPAQAAGVYVATPSDSGYSDAVQRLRSLFAGSLAELVAPTLQALVAPNLASLVARSLTELADPLIVREVPAPGQWEAVVASATGWAAINEEFGEPFWQQVAAEFDLPEQFADFAADWMQRAGV